MCFNDRTLPRAVVFFFLALESTSLPSSLTPGSTTGSPDPKYPRKTDEGSTALAEVWRPGGLTAWPPFCPRLPFTASVPNRGLLKKQRGRLGGSTGMCAECFHLNLIMTLCREPS